MTLGVTRPRITGAAAITWLHYIFGGQQYVVLTLSDYPTGYPVSVGKR